MLEFFPAVQSIHLNSRYSGNDEMKSPEVTDPYWVHYETDMHLYHWVFLLPYCKKVAMMALWIHWC